MTTDTTDRTEIAIKSVHQGNHQQAYQQFAILTQETPDDLQSWLWRAALAETVEEQLSCLSMVLDQQPDHPIACQGLYQVLWEQMEEDAFLNYGSETDHLYYVRTAKDTAVAVPKHRRPPDPYPPPQPGSLQPAWRWLRWALLGLLPAGLGAILFAPLAAVSALRAGRRPLSADEKNSRRIALALALLFWLVGLALTFILFLHI